jgi:hypothetical protein
MANTNNSLIIKVLEWWQIKIRRVRRPYGPKLLEIMRI